jgi:long-chain acyl-CoA synthetase
MLIDLAGANPNAIAVDDTRSTRTWAELLDRSVRVAHYLREVRGIEPDDRVAILMGNRVEYIELILGALLAGVWITPVNWHLGQQEIAYIIADSDAKLVFSDDRFGSTAREAGGVEVLLAGSELDAALAGASDRPVDLDGPAGGSMIYTSGTTGHPKGVKRARPPSAGAALANMCQLGRNVGLDGSGPHLITGPMYHAAPLMFAIYDQANGAPIVIMPRWEEEMALNLIDERRVCHTHLVPTMFVRLLRVSEAARQRFSGASLNLVLHGAAPISIAVKRRMIEWWGEILVEYWGATEGGVNTLVDSAGWLAKLGTVGRALPQFEVFAVDDLHRRLPAGETGQLYCHHKQVEHVFEYHGDPEKTAAAFLSPGVFTIGDIGRVDADGHVYLADRASNTIISGGVNIYPVEVEQALQEHPAVADVGVFGIPDDEWGESVKAAIELRDGFQPSEQLEAEILAFAGEQLARYKVPRSIDFELTLPRHPTGKLYIRLLRDRYWKDRATNIA